MSFFAILFSFKGRVNRAKFWMVNLLLIVVVGIMVLIYGEEGSVILFPFGILCFWAGLAITAKRWHDRNKSAWWILIELIPILGPIWAFVELGFCKGTDGPNRFGPDPLKKQ
ncbi:DUF805 domain-containing protein [Candidatus Poribacteria bacterium]|nr:MAG: DUF805 domain-containing protein [Candidatus Poribacteria bacterium]